MRGYVSQYAIAARVIYERICSGELSWVGLADRSAASFDDVVLGLSDRIIAYQIKSKRDPSPFSFNTILLGADNLLQKLVAAWQSLRAGHAGCAIELIFLTADFPRTTDTLAKRDQPKASSAAFYRTHQAHHIEWSPEDWGRTAFSVFWKSLQRASGLTDSEFAIFWRSIGFQCGATRSGGSALPATLYDQQRIDRLAALLPTLVAEEEDKDRWTATELLKRLKWREPKSLAHSHIFPIDSAVQSNPATEDALSLAINSVDRGYLCLLGPPGSGKSTLLQSSLLPTPQAAILRYLAFVPDEGHGLGRAEAIDFLHDVVSQLTNSGVGLHVFPDDNLPELRSQFEKLLNAAALRYERDRVKTIIVIDGLDHVPREEKPSRSLLTELPLPHSIPAGVLILLGSQKLDLDGLPPGVVTQASEVGRRFDIAPLPKQSILELAKLANLPTDIDLNQLYEASGGHPLAARYLIAALATASADQTERILSDDFAPGKDLNAFYERAWNELANATEARDALAYLSLIEGSIAAVELDKLVGTSGTDAAWKVAGHLLRIDESSRISIFHNSFRLFLLEKTNLRFGRRDEELLRQRYRSLAEMAKGCDKSDPQRWLELRYRGRAKDRDEVLALATPIRFRSHFIAGRDPRDIQDDIRLGFAACAETRNAEKLFELILVRHEIETRSSSIAVDALLDAYIAIGDLEKARGLVDAANLTIAAPFGLVDAYLAAGRIDDARDLFEELEPTNKLYGAEAIDSFRLDDDLQEWAERALVFRKPHQVIAALERLRLPDRPAMGERSLDEIRNHLKFIAACNASDGGSLDSFRSTLDSLLVPTAMEPALRIYAAEQAAAFGDLSAARIHLAAACAQADGLSEDWRERAALLSLDLADSASGAKYFEGLVAPVYDRDGYSDNGDAEARSIFRYAFIEATLEKAPAPRSYASSKMLAAFQRKLERIGRLAAEGFAGRQKAPDVVWRELGELLAFMQVSSTRGGFDSERWKLEKSLGRVARIAIYAADCHGKAALERTITEIDALLAQTDVGLLGSNQFRKSYALAVYDMDRRTTDAIMRLEAIAEFGGEQTPEEYVHNVADAAKTFATVGAFDRARELLKNLYEHTLGVSAPAKKDGQYELWRDLYRRACAEDPRGAEKRIKFFSRLLSGLSETIGRGAAGRVAVDHLIEAARFSPELGDAVSRRLQEHSLLEWPSLLGGVLLGVTQRDPHFAIESACIFSRIAIPFLGDLDDDILGGLLELAPSADKKRLLTHAVRCIEIDADIALRRPLLNRLNDVASKYGLAVPDAVLHRWKQENEPSDRSSMDDDPFAGISSLEELPELISKAGENNSYRAVNALVRLAPNAPLGLVKHAALLPVIAENGRALHAIALAALSAGDLDYVETLRQKLEAKAVEHGSWGSWQSGAKYRLHSLLVDLEGEPAKVRAFDLFARDLAQGREWTVSLLPSLIDIFELLSPRPSWSAMWDMLTDHLEQFREYQTGEELLVAGTKSDEEILSDFIFCGLSLSLHDMSWQCRLAAQELADSCKGPTILRKLLERLAKTEGDSRVDAVRIAWECRDCAALREDLVSLAEQMVQQDDVAVVVYGARLGEYLGNELELPRRPLPGFYSLKFPEDAQADEFDKPSGYSQFSAGLWTDDTHSWTWPLRRPLRFLAAVSQFDLATLRRRAGELMRRNGGRASFGPEVVEARARALRRLDLQITFRRLPVLAAFRAFRQLCCELASAGECDPRAITMLAAESGGPAYLMRTFEAQPRPRFINRSLISGAFGAAEVAAWREAGEDAAKWPLVDDDAEVIACIAEFDRISYSRKRTETRLMLRRDEPIVAKEFLDGLSELPTIDVIDGLMTRYRGIANGGVVCVRKDIAGSTPDNLLMLCPRLAEQVGLSPHPTNPFAYTDDTGAIAVQTIWWRDGGVARYGGDRSIRGQGSVVVATREAFGIVKPYLGGQRYVHVWRSSADDERPTELSTNQFISTCGS
ncbi:ATP-binding protein [Bradyrhizobium oligotrophicum]|uniref:ATP-binding protein n=1 Tax=Bradyrhizobium oligotrophicum TaxID=44255 RepID=UPI003EBE0F5E